MAAVTTPFDSSKDVFAKDKVFWNNYLKGRPSAPDVFLKRLFRYHQKHHGKFSTVHDHVIISDIAPDNVAFAKDRLGTDGFSYRAARVEEGDDIPNGSVDMVFATNMMHFCDQKLAMEVIAKQLRSGGTFACAAFGAAHFEDPRVQDIYVRMGQTGARALLKTLNDPEKLIAAMARTKGAYNVAPLDEALFLPGAQRIHLNMPEGGMTSPLPPEMPVSEPVHTSTSDVEVFEMHIASFPFGRDESALFAELWREMEDVVKDQPVKGHWPAKIILATRR